MTDKKAARLRVGNDAVFTRVGGCPALVGWSRQNVIPIAGNFDLSARGFLPGASSRAQVKTLSGWY